MEKTRVYDCGCSQGRRHTLMCSEAAEHEREYYKVLKRVAKTAKEAEENRQDVWAFEQWKLARIMEQAINVVMKIHYEVQILGGEYTDVSTEDLENVDEMAEVFWGESA